ncbi:MAG: ADP-ribosylation factor-like protein, partial [Candidatus Helarchaeota archaeon]
MTELSDIVNDLVGKPSKIDFPQKIRNLLDAIKIPDLKEIPNLPIHDLRDVSVQEGKILEKFLKVKTIKDLAKVTYKDLIKYSAKIRENGVSQDKLELLITTARYIVEAVNYEPTEERKIVLAGLDNAGKTAILKIIKKEMGISTIGSMKPTKGASRDELILEDQKMHIIELGGQEEFRKFYIENPNRYFLDTDIIVYLIDMQDDARYTQSLDYLKQILQVLRHLQEPIPGGFIILLNKCDPDFLELPIFREKIEFMKEKIEELFQAFNQSQSQIM